MIYIILTIVVVTAVAVYIGVRKSNTVKIPFKESIDLIDLPIVTFKNNRVKLHFLLDTGSDDSYVDASVLKRLGVKPTDKSMVITASDTVESLGTVNLDIVYKDKVFSDKFTVMDMSRAFSAIRQQFGVTLHGIIGSRFFNKYDCILDFDKFEMRSK